MRNDRSPDNAEAEENFQKYWRPAENRVKEATLDRKNSNGDIQNIRKRPSELDPSKYAPGKNHFRKRNHSQAISATNKNFAPDRENMITRFECPMCS